MTAPRTVPPSPPARAAVLAAAGGRRRTAAVVALAVAGALAGSAVAPASAAPAGPAGRVVVSALGDGGAGVRTAARAVRAAGGRVLEELPLVSGVAADLPRGVQLPSGLLVTPDRPLRVSGGSGDLPADAPASPVRQTLGLGAPAGEGAGVTVAVVDTGVEAVPDLAGRLAQVDVTGTGQGDGYGHGTFVAGLVAGSGAASGGTYAGVAPGARVLSVRVADDDGSTDLVTVLRGLQVAAARGADVVNLSLSSYSPLPWQLDPLTLALTALWQRGTVVVVPAGNDGPDAGTVTSPGTAPALLTVGALDEQGTASRADDTVAGFSGRGPTPQGVDKPELVAPGRSVVSLRDPGSVIDRAYGAAAAVGPSYFKGSGTSFSTAVASGAAAVLLAERRLSPDQVKQLLVGTAYDAAGLADPGAGAGGLDLAAARTAAVPADGQGRNGRRVGQLRRDADLPGTRGEWQPLLSALLRGDAAAAASSWSALPAELRQWVASSWSALPADMRAALTEPWVGRSWAGLTPEQWAAADWAARTWAASSWSGRNWGGRSWGASSWSDDATGWMTGWDGRNWGGRTWAGRNWAASSWAGRSWAAGSWAADWAGRTWSVRSWAAASWS